MTSRATCCSWQIEDPRRWATLLNRGTSIAVWVKKWPMGTFWPSETSKLTYLCTLAIERSSCVTKSRTEMANIRLFCPELWTREPLQISMPRVMKWTAVHRRVNSLWDPIATFVTNLKTVWWKGARLCGCNIRRRELIWLQMTKISPMMGLQRCSCGTIREKVQILRVRPQICSLSLKLSKMILTKIWANLPNILAISQTRWLVEPVVCILDWDI